MNNKEPKGTLLVVDDSPENLHLLVDILTADGYRVLPANSGKLALAAVAARPPELILLDIRMPGLGGFEVYRRLKSQAESCDIPVIFISAFGESAERVEGLKLGAVDFISKPIQQEELLARVQTHLELRRLHVQLDQQATGLRLANAQLQAELAERRRAEAALATIAERLALATRAGGVGIWDYDVTNNRLAWDEQMYRLYGINPRAFGCAYESWQAGLHPEDRRRGMEDIEAALRGEKEFDSEFRVVWPDGTIRHIRAIALVQRDQSSQPLRMIGTNWDVSKNHKLRALEQALEAQRQQLQKSESLSRMAGAIAHHFNNQLQVVMLNLEPAISSQLGKAGSSGDLSVAMQAARKAAEVSSQMLTYLGRSHPRMEQLNLAEICRQALILLESALPVNVVFETDLPSPGPGLRADASQIKQILISLITNAWEAGGNERIAIRLTVNTASAAEILAADHFPVDWQPQVTSYAYLEVTDRGPGIAAAEIQNIFDPFYSTKFTGRGLGLSVVLGIARSHAGVVTVKSEPGRGSAFRVFFPELALAVPQKLVPVNLIPVRRTVGPHTVLVVEDNSALRETLVIALELSAFKVLAAGDGIEAMELFRQHRDEIDCVLCDVVMPRMNGWETLTALRQLEPGLPVILASGFDETDFLQGDHPERPQAFLKKPFSLEECCNALRRLTTPPA